jgi:hypothetical protein
MMSAHIFEPDDFVLGTMDEQISVTYSTHGVVGPQLTYHNEADATGGGTYAGDDLQVEETILGTLVSVTLGWTPDAERRYLTVLLPTVLLEDRDGVEVNTFVVLTSLLEGQVRRGQMHEYTQALRVQGSASRVGPV